MKSQSTIKSEVSHDLAQLAKDNETKHTPTPWMITEETSNNDFLIRADNGGDEELVCRVIDTPGKSSPEHEANAAFIVRACNEHAAHVALEEVALYACCGSPCQHNRCQGIRDVLARLTAARGGRPPVSAAEHNAFPKGRW